MVKRVLWWLLWFVIVLLIVLFLIGGGIGKIAAAARQIGHPLSSGGALFMLPWQVPIPQGPDISNITDSSESPSPSADIGNPSPYQDTFSVSTDGADSGDPKTEYLKIQNSGQGTVDITGWSLQSVLSGVRAYLPRGAAFFEMGALNEQGDIAVAPGGIIIVSSGLSPVGTSFRENECSGYLGELQTYTPAIGISCPDPSIDIAQAQSYGQSCADFVSSLPSCTFPQSVPSNLSLGCQQFVQTTFSYNGCVQEHDSESGFSRNSWRVYLGATHELWRNDHDTIRLLDAQSQVVAVTSY